jgi:hypothetical protein
MTFNAAHRSILSAVGVLGVSLPLVGCGSSRDETAPYASAVSDLEKHGEKIREAFMSGNPENAHDALHIVGEILDQFPKLVEGTKLSAADREAVNLAGDKLFDAYTELDMSLHGDEKTQYEKVAEAIEANLAILVGQVAAAGSSDEYVGAANAADHDHAANGEHAHAHGSSEEHEHHGEGHSHAEGQEQPVDAEQHEQQHQAEESE